jgi:hypothetical protein
VLISAKKVIGVAKKKTGFIQIWPISEIQKTIFRSKMFYMKIDYSMLNRFSGFGHLQ